MSLRRCPRRTAALLAANRANAQKSTGPRTAPGKQRSAVNAFRTGNRTAPAFWTRGLSQRELAEFHALRDALDRALGAGTEDQKRVGLATVMVWSVRRLAERQLRTMKPEIRRNMAMRRIPVPRCWHRKIPHSGWKITVTVFGRRARRRRSELSSIPAVGAIRIPEAKPARVHVITRVSCTGHPQFNRGPEGVPLSTKPGSKPPEKRRNPECSTIQADYKNIAPNADSPGSEAKGCPRCQAIADDNAPPWELPEGYVWTATTGKGS